MSFILALFQRLTLSKTMSTVNKKGKRESKKKSLTTSSARSSTNAIYARSSQKILRPSTKLDFDSWTNMYTSKIQSLWNESYLSILEQETSSKLPLQTQIQSQSNGNIKNKGKRNSKKKNSKKSKLKETKSKHQSLPSRSSMIAIPKKGLSAKESFSISMLSCD